MEKEQNLLTNEIKSIANDFLEKTKNKDIQIISHNDTDGITSAAIMIRTLKKLDKTFSVKIIKNLEESVIQNLDKNKITIFLDLASNGLDYIKKHNIQDVFIIDHHELIQEIPENVKIINPQLNGKEKISASCLTYLFCKEIFPIKENAKLAILGLIGDFLEKNIDKLNNQILIEGEIMKKRGLLLYPATRPLNIVLEYNTNPYIPGITGNTEGVRRLLREVGLAPNNGKYKSLMELEEKEMSKLITAILLRTPKTNNESLIGDMFLVKLFNKLEDAREMSAKINACSRLGESDTAIKLCLEIPSAKKKAESLHAKYRQSIISALNFASKTEKIQGKNYLIIDAKTEIKDTIVGVIASILSKSPIYEQGTIITMMADYGKDKVKISSRNVGENGRNIREILNNVIQKIGGEVGGHKEAAGGLIQKSQQDEFVKNLQKNLEIELVKI